MIEEVKTKTPPPKKPHYILRMVAFLITVALVAGAVFLVVNRDKLNFDALKRWFTYRTLAQSDTGGGQSFPYQGGNDLALVVCNGDLLSVSQTGVRLYSPGGTAYVEDTVTLENPACHVAGKGAVVYDAGGSFLRVYRDRTQVFDLDDASATVLSARLNDSGYLAVVSRSSGYKGVVTVYDNKYHPLLALRISSSYVLDAVVSPDNHAVLVVTAGQKDGLFSAQLARYSLSDVDVNAPEPTEVFALGNRLPLDLVWDHSGVRVLTEYAALAADSGFAQTGIEEWSDRYLKRYSLLCDDHFVVLTGKYRSASQTQLAIIDRNGETVARREENRPILAISAAGKYIGVLTAQRLDIYTQDLTLYASTEDTQDACYLVQMANGSAYLATHSSAWVYLPD